MYLDERLHSVEHKTTMKPVSPPNYRKGAIKMIADVYSNNSNSSKSIHNRLGYKNGITSKSDSDVGYISRHLNAVNIRKNSSLGNSFYKHQSPKKTSVFDRLGFQ